MNPPISDGLLTIVALSAFDLSWNARVAGFISLLPPLQVTVMNPRVASCSKVIFEPALHPKFWLNPELFMIPPPLIVKAWLGSRL